MQQPCSRCGYISDRPARFCRQCGSPLFNETESSSATTRNYMPQQAPPQFGNQPNAYSPYGPGASLEEQAPDTTPFYRPPAMAQYPVPQQSRSGWGKWVLIGLLSFLLITSLAVGGAIYVGKRWIQHKVESAHRDGTIEIPEAPPPPVNPSEPGAPPAPSTGLEGYKYPEAKILESHKDGMNEVLKMTTEDDIQTVKEYYDEKFKNSSVNISNQDGQKFIFTTLGHPLITIIVQPDESHEGNTEINLIRANLSIPKITIPKITIPKIEIP